MKRIVLLVCLAGTVSAVPFAQSQDDVIARAVLAAPPALQADAAVVAFDDDGGHEVLREGTNGLVCYDRSHEPGREFSVQCTSEANLPRVAQNHRARMAAANAEEAEAMLAGYEADGTREAPEFGSVWYSLNGADEASANAHVTIAVPFATTESLGLPSQGDYRRAGTWIMDAGTSGAHIMVPGR